MKKSELKTGMRVRTRNGQIYLVIKDVQHVDGHEELAFINKQGFTRGSNYNDELINIFGHSNNFDVMEVYTINEKLNSLLNAYTFDLNKRFLIWKRQEYTDMQKEIFKALKVLGFNWIARDDNRNMLMAYDEKPIKTGGYWDVNLGEYACDIAYDFDFIKWEDEEPFEIPTL